MENQSCAAGMFDEQWQAGVRQSIRQAAIGETISKGRRRCKRLKTCCGFGKRLRNFPRRSAKGGHALPQGIAEEACWSCGSRRFRWRSVIDWVRSASQAA